MLGNYFKVFFDIILKINELTYLNQKYLNHDYKSNTRIFDFVLQ